MTRRPYRPRRWALALLFVVGAAIAWHLLLPEGLEVVVQDEGSGFDVAGVNGDITSPEHIFDARGRGIFIMRSCMDRVDFEFTGSGTRVRLVKNRPAKAENS